jgi:hypothetical protein
MTKIWASFNVANWRRKSKHRRGVRTCRESSTGETCNADGMFDSINASAEFNGLLGNCVGACQ